MAISSVAAHAEIAKPKVTPASANAKSTANSNAKGPGGAHPLRTITNSSSV